MEIIQNFYVMLKETLNHSMWNSVIFMKFSREVMRLKTSMPYVLIFSLLIPVSRKSLVLPTAVFSRNVIPAFCLLYSQSLRMSGWRGGIYQPVSAL
jgi:hypothetical protein